MDPSVPTAAADPEPTLALSIAPALAQEPLELPGLLSPSPLPFPGQEVDGSERESTFKSPSSTDGSLLYVLEGLVFGGPGCALQVIPQGRSSYLQVSDPWYRRGSYLAMYFEPHASFCFEQATGGATSAEVTKADSKFHHPIRLFWPKSRSFDYLYSYGEILLQNFPVQATINLYEDSDSEEEDNCEEEDGDEEQEKKEADKKGPEGCLRILRSAPHRVTSHPPSPSLTCPN